MGDKFDMGEELTSDDPDEDWYDDLDGVRTRSSYFSNATKPPLIKRIKEFFERVFRPLPKDPTPSQRNIIRGERPFEFDESERNRLAQSDLDRQRLIMRAGLAGRSIESQQSFETRHRVMQLDAERRSRGTAVPTDTNIAIAERLEASIAQRNAIVNQYNSAIISYGRFYSHSLDADGSSHITISHETDIPNQPSTKTVHKKNLDPVGPRIIDLNS